MQPLDASLWLVLYCVCVLAHGCTGFMRGWNRTWVWAVWEVQKHFCKHLLRAYLFLSVWTLVFLPQAGYFIAKAVVFMYYLFTHPLCALSAFESLGCSLVAALGDLKRDPVGLGAENVFWAFISTRECCWYVFRRSKWNACHTIF